MIIKEHISGDVTVLALQGDFISEPDQKRFLDRITSLVAGGSKHVIIDLRESKILNSCGLGSLVCALTKLRKAKGDLRLANVGIEVRHLLVITRLEEVFSMYGSVEEALESAHAHVG